MLDRSTPVSTPKKKKRWMLRLFLLVIILIVAVIVTVQVVLRTQYPKSIVLGEVEHALGLNVQVKSFSTGWWGHTVLRDVTISLPLAEKAFLNVPELRVEHSSLPMIALRRGVKLDSIVFDHPDMIVRQDESGRWDLQQAVELMTRAGGAKNTGEQQQQPTLPELTLSDGSIHIIDRDGREARVEPVNFHGAPQNSLAWQFSAKVNDQLLIEGAVNPGRVWEHAVTFSIEQIDPWLKPWVKDLPNPLAVKGRWEGRVIDGQLRGQVRLERAVASDIKANGVVNLVRDENGVHLRPDGFVIQRPAPIAPEIRATSGEITLEANRVVAKALQLAAAGGTARINGNYSWASVAGELEATWEELALPTGSLHGGSAKASIKTPLPNRPEIAVEVHTRGEGGGAKWKSDLNLIGKGESWQKIEWNLAVPLLEFVSAKRRFELHSFGARFATNDDKLQLVEITHTGPEILRGTGELNFSNKNWAIDLSASALQLPSAATGTLDLAVQASGTAFDLVDLKKAHLRYTDLVIESSGSYASTRPRPVNLSVNISQNPTIAEEENDPLVKGNLQSEFSLVGTLAPLELGIDGRLNAKQLTIRDRSIGDATLEFNGQLNPNGASIRTTELEALGGRWKIVGTWAGEDEPVKLRVTARDLPLRNVAQVASKQNVSGTMAGEWDLITSSLRPSRMKLTGQATVVKPAAGPISAEKLTSNVSMENGIVRLDPIEAQQEQGRLNASARFPLLHPTQWHVEAQTTEWPYPLPREGSSIRVAAKTTLDADLANRTAIGTLTASSDLVLNKEPAGVVKVSAIASGDVIQLNDISANLIAGTLSGSGAIQCKNLLQSHLILRLQDADAKKVAGIWPQVADLSGVYNALVVIAPTTDVRALGPMRLSLSVYPTGGRFKTVSIGNIDVVAYADRQQGQSRIVIDDSSLSLAEGQVRFWGRRSEHPGATTQQSGSASTQMEVEFAELNLDQLTHAFKPDGKLVPGLVDGSFTLVGPLADRDHLFGAGKMRLRRSDLGNSQLFGGIYNSLNLRFGQREPDGEGEADLRLQGDMLEINNAHYRIGGAEIRMNGTITKLWEAPDSPIRGKAIGSVQPFADWKIPIIKQASAFFATIQNNTVGAFRIAGTAGKPEVVPAAFGDAVNIFGDLLGIHTDDDK